MSSRLSLFFLCLVFVLVFFFNFIRLFIAFLNFPDAGDVYSWGSGTKGQLGCGREVSYYSPSLIEELVTKRVRYIACGRNHAAALTGVYWSRA